MRLSPSTTISMTSKRALFVPFLCPSTSLALPESASQQTDSLVKGDNKRNRKYMASCLLYSILYLSARSNVSAIFFKSHLRQSHNLSLGIKKKNSNLMICCSLSQLTHSLLADCFSWQLYHSRGFIQALTKNHKKINAILKFGDSMHLIMNNTWQSTISIASLVSDLCHFQIKASFQHEYFNSRTLQHTIKPNQYGGSVR